MIDPDLIAEAHAVDQTMTAAPWFAKEDDLLGGHCIMSVDRTPLEAGSAYAVAAFVGEDDAAHIAWMRNMFPTLLAELVETQAALDELRKDRAVELVSIAGKQARDRARIAEAPAFIKQHASWDLVSRVETILAGDDRA